MTSYEGLPERHRALVVKFREALMRKIEATNGSLEMGEDFAEIDATYHAEGERLAEHTTNPRRRRNWGNTYLGAAESQKLRMVFEISQDMLSPEEIAACAPEEIERDGVCFSRYEMEKNGLTDLTDYLVPKAVREIGLF